MQGELFALGILNDTNSEIVSLSSLSFSLSLHFPRNIEAPELAL